MTVDRSKGFETKTTHGNAQPSTSSVTDGPGGGTMDIWEKPRATKLNQLAGATFTNESIFGVPKGVVDTKGFESGWQTDEMMHGFGFAGQSLDPNKEPLAGSISLLGDGDPMGGGQGSGLFVVSVAPDAHANGVLTGTDATDPLADTWDIEYTPIPDAMSHTETNVAYPRPAFFDIVYGGVAGQIVDVEDAPVENVVVSSRGITTSTDTNGKFLFYAPGGQTITLTTLDGTVESAVSTEKANIVSEHFQFGGVKVTVTGPNDTPVPNVPVEVAGKSIRTDERGVALFPARPLRDYTVSIMDQYTEDITVGSQGQIVPVKHDGGTLISVTVKDARNNQPVQQLPGFGLNAGILGFTNDDGQLRLAAFEQNDYEVLVGYDDNRYKRKTVTETVTNGNVKEVTVKVEPAVITTNQ